MAGRPGRSGTTGLQTNIPFVTFAFGGGSVFAGSEFNGVFKTANNGVLWTAINNGLTDLRVNSLAVNAAKNRLLAGTGGRSSPSGIYERLLTGDADWQHYNGNLSGVMGQRAGTERVVHRFGCYTSILTFWEIMLSTLWSNPMAKESGDWLRAWTRSDMESAGAFRRSGSGS